MKRVNNRDARHYVQQRLEFQGSNTAGRWVTNSKGEGRYCVYSYGTHFPMYIWESGQWYANCDKYSRSTSTHQTQLHPLEDVMLMDTDTMITLARHGIAGVAVGL